MDPAMQEQLLQQLRDIHAPGAIGWWPLAPGWWVLAFLALLITIAISAWLYRIHRRDAYRRQALVVAEYFYNQFGEDGDIGNYLGQINQLLRRVLLSIRQDKKVADVSGEAWVAALNAHGQRPLSDQAGNALSEQLYRPDPVADIAVLHQELTAWIRSHRRAPRV